VAITSPVFATREAVKRALDIKETARANREIDDALVAATNLIATQCNDRTFWPVTAERAFNYPQPYGHYYRVWLWPNELLSFTTITSAGQTIPANWVFLEPVNEGPPYVWIELDLGSTDAAWTVGSTSQHAIKITGDWGYTAQTVTVTTLTAGINASQSTLIVDDSTRTDVGSLLVIESERLLVTDRAYTTTGVTITGDLTASTAVTTIPLSGQTIYPGETIRVDAETMLVVDTTPTGVIVKRAWDGSVLAAHTTGATVYASRLLTVTRAATGSPAAPHGLGVTVATWVPPVDVAQLCVAEAIVYIEQNRGGWPRTQSTTNIPSGNDINSLRQLVYDNYTRRRPPGVA
jgi:hypothetical protein